MKLADALVVPPYQMSRARDALLQWVNGDDHVASLDISYCSFHVIARARAASHNDRPAMLQRAMGLEPDPNAVVVVGGQDIAPEAPVNIRWHTLYSLAGDLVQEHGHEWPAAIDIARLCMARVGNMSEAAEAYDRDNVEALALDNDDNDNAD